MTRRGMLRLAAAAASLLFLVVLLTRELPASDAWTYWTLPLSGRTIAIDAGHGGVDGGAVSREGIIEKDLNLAIALYVRDYLQQAGALVLLTREDDRDLAEEGTKGYSRRKTQDLIKRADLIKAQKPDLFVSIHMNSIPSSRYSGAQTFYYPSHPGNSELAAMIQAEIKRTLSNTSRTAATVNTVYLLKAIDTVPAALVEVGFLSNPEESRRLAETDYQRAMSAAIYQGILRYFTEGKAAKSGGGTG